MPKKSKDKKSPASSSSHESDESSDGDKHDETIASSSKHISKKIKKPIARRATPTSTAPTEVKEFVVRKRMASLNASAMLAATYEVERHLDRVDSLYDSRNSGDREHDTAPTVPKKLKDIKDEVLDSKEVNIRFLRDQIYVHAQLEYKLKTKNCFPSNRRSPIPQMLSSCKTQTSQ